MSAVADTTPVPATAESPASTAPSSPPDIQTGDIDQVVAAAARGAYDPPGGAENPPGTPDSQAGAAGEESGQGPTATGPDSSPAQAGPEDYKRKFESVSGNNKTLAETNRQYQQQLAQHQAQLQATHAQLQQMQAAHQRELQMREEEFAIRQALPDPHLQEQAIREYRQQQQKAQEQEQFAQVSDEYVGYLRQQQDQINHAQVVLFQQSLPPLLPQLAEHIASSLQAPVETLKAIATTPQMVKALGMVGMLPTDRHLAQRDMDMISEVLAAVASVEKGRDSTRRQENGQRAAASGQYAPMPDTIGRGDGLTPSDRIRNMSDSDFDAHVERLRREAESRMAYR